MLVVVIISAFDLSNATVVKRPSVAHNATRFALIEPPKDEVADYSFAEENLPVENKRVNRKMSYSLWMHSYTKVQSNILHIKAEKLFPVIVPILEKYGIPEDFKYLPLVESGLREGTSRKGARGPWQFMPGTARSYGLKVSKNKDERLNLRKSTVAACKYLNELFDEFGSWTLAAAAYNNGSIKLVRAMHKQHEENYFRMHLNHETGMYVYKLVAMKQVIENPEKYGYKEFYAQAVTNTDLMTFN
ncbi:lytic transglycosylase domain-containing protein [Mucilaginibacter sp. UR6-1]|nr:lytic transglycosylase domain-containing protein [Mucilaginibacter sp. UR6-1]